ncbi:unnamed protein product [Protopolystoma xenopodis]|uniref:Uncharacterized protein n=1 Tax=Protopolystoma xenopodis TaxID=117903 RepID=A0A3S5FH26_9PLAT|nr:unnamed protein product [Protopolystoma xenopodis]
MPFTSHSVSCGPKSHDLLRPSLYRPVRSASVFSIMWSITCPRRRSSHNLRPAVFGFVQLCWLTRPPESSAARVRLACA